MRLAGNNAAAYRPGAFDDFFEAVIDQAAAWAAAIEQAQFYVKNRLLHFAPSSETLRNATPCERRRNAGTAPKLYLVDLGMAGKVLPVVIVTREDTDAPRALSVTVPSTTQNRGTQYEVQMPRVPWLKQQSFANIQAIAAYEHHEFLERRGRFDNRRWKRSSRPSAGLWIS